MTTNRLLRCTVPVLFAFAWSSGAAAQSAQPAQPRPPAQPAQAAQPAQPAQPAQGPSPEQRREPQALPERNVRVTITLTDQLADSPPVVRTAVMTIADGRQGQIRSQTSIRRDARLTETPATTVTADQLPLNVDAWVNTTDAGAVLLRLGFTYFVTGSDELSGTGFVVTRRDLTENLSVLVKPGQSMVVSESADPVSDRKVKVEVKAEILP